MQTHTGISGCSAIMSKHILITGATGLIGQKLTDLLLKKGYRVSHISRSLPKNGKVKTYLWNVRKQFIDDNCLNDVDTIIHLAGAPIAQKRWTAKRKEEILESRTQSIALLYQVMRQKPNKVKTVISASATGYYSDRGEELLDENSSPATDFLGTCCVKWEQAVDEGKEFNCRIVKYRTGVVLDKDGGALKPMVFPVKLGIGSPLGSGKQWVPWIHYQDVINLYLFAIENEALEGVFNMTAPHPAMNEELMHALAKTLRKPWWAPRVPAFVLKLLMGEMAKVVLASTKTSAEKIYLSGYEFKYVSVEDALKAIYGKN